MNSESESDSSSDGSIDDEAKLNHEIQKDEGGLRTTNTFVGKPFRGMDLDEVVDNN